MKRYTLTPAGFEKIGALQDKYRFQNTFEIEDTDGAIEFLEDLCHSYYTGLNIDPDDLEWIETSIDVLTSYPHDE